MKWRIRGEPRIKWGNNKSNKCSYIFTNRSVWHRPKKEKNGREQLQWSWSFFSNSENEEEWIWSFLWFMRVGVGWIQRLSQHWKPLLFYTHTHLSCHLLWLHFRFVLTILWVIYHSIPILLIVFQTMELWMNMRMNQFPFESIRVYICLHRPPPPRCRLRFLGFAMRKVENLHIPTYYWIEMSNEM